MIDQIIVQVFGCHTFKAVDNQVFQSAVVVVDGLDVEGADGTSFSWNADMAQLSYPMKASDTVSANQ